MGKVCIITVVFVILFQMAFPPLLSLLELLPLFLVCFWQQALVPQPLQKQGCQLLLCGNGW